MSNLQTADAFPYDCLDQIFAFACGPVQVPSKSARLAKTPEAENLTVPSKSIFSFGPDVGSSPQSPTKSPPIRTTAITPPISPFGRSSFNPDPRLGGGIVTAVALSRVCQFWYERFLNCDEMWGIILSQSSFASVLNWKSHSWTKRAYLMAKDLLPLTSSTLTPIEDCSLNYQCPVYAELLHYKGGREFHCDGCGKSTFLVTNTEEKKEQRAKGNCVMMLRASDTLSSHEEENSSGSGSLFASLSSVNNTRVNVLIVAEDRKDHDTRVRRFLKSLAAESRFERSSFVFPSLLLKKKPGLFSSRRARQSNVSYYFKTLLEEEIAGYDNTDTSICRFSAVVMTQSAMEKAKGIEAERFPSRKATSPSPSTGFKNPLPRPSEAPPQLPSPPTGLIVECDRPHYPMEYVRVFKGGAPLPIFSSPSAFDVINQLENKFDPAPPERSMRMMYGA